MCKNWGTELYVAGDYIKSLNFRDYVKSLVTHIPCYISVADPGFDLRGDVDFVKKREEIWRFGHKQS